MWQAGHGRRGSVARRCGLDFVLFALLAGLKRQLQASKQQQEPGGAQAPADLGAALGLGQAPTQAPEAGLPASTAEAADEASTSGQETPPPHAELISPKYGYAALGGFVPERAGPSSFGDLGVAQPRVHPSRRFFPGQTYSPQVGAMHMSHGACTRAL